MSQHFLTEIVALILAGAGIAYVCFRLGLVPIVGFLIAGVVIGPNALGLIRDRDLVDAAAELGVIFLLFTIGIEFSLEKLARLKTVIFAGGGLQVGLASLATMAILMAFGVEWRAGLFTGFLVALSSTAIVLKILADRGETSAPHGQVALGLLIFQDLAVVVMVLLVPMLAGGGGGDSGWGIGLALAKAGLIIAVVLLFARRFMPHVLELVARTCSPELFLLTVIAICLGTAFVTSLAGVSLSLGAFLAGLVVSESRFSEHALSEILPLQILFSATFFVSVGMLLDVGFLLGHLPLVLGSIVLVLVVKLVTTAASVRVLGYATPVAAVSAAMLAQVGEFSFVLERAGRDLGLSPAGLVGGGSQAFIASTVVLMIATPLLASLGGRAVQRLRGEAFEPETEEPVEGPHAPLESHVVVAGYGQAARRLVRVLQGSGIPYVITTLSPEGADEAEAEGLPVVLGDATRQRTLLLAGADRAKMLVVADDDPATARRVVAVARTVNPTMRIVVRTRYIAEVEPLTEAGADSVIAEELEGVVQLFTDVMRTYEVSPEEMQRHEDAIRSGGYASLRATDRPRAPIVECDLGPDCLDHRAITVREGSAAAGRSLASLDLPRRYAISPRAWGRGGRWIDDPAGETVLRAGDELALSGTGAAFAEAAPLFRVGGDGGGDEAARAGPGGARQEVAMGKIDTETVVTHEIAPDAAGCAHAAQIRPVVPSAPGCEECLASGSRWVHLRLCMSCGHVGCCDDSPNRHATAHHRGTGHPIFKSLEPGEGWAWCYVDEVVL